MDGHTSLTLYLKVAGIIFNLLAPCFTGLVPVLGPASVPPSPGQILEMITHSKPHGIILPPFLIEAISTTPSAWEALKSLNVVCYAGAPLSPSLGEQLRKTTTLWNGIGATEATAYATVQVDAEDWQYHRFHPSAGAVFEPQDDLGLYELVFEKRPDSLQATNIFRTFPELQRYPTKDLWMPHPIKEGLWRYSGRTDDLVLLTGEIKLYAEGIEEAVRLHPAVSEALVGGDGRIKPFLLVWLAVPGTEGEGSVVNDVWRHVEGVNSHNAETARIHRRMIIVGSTPFVRTPKGTVDRRKTIQLYEDAVEGLYSGAR
jgi:acyl-coenzyme A synthetase/AMP-(fatty) acid ligase